jgi:two-component system, OmpR family, sensor kinase
MSSGSTLSRRWQKARQLPGRVPLRIKLITAVLALVAIALSVISVASIVLFRDYQLRHASQQVVAVFEQSVADLGAPHGIRPGMVQGVGSYLVAMLPAGTSMSSVQSDGGSVPDVPTSTTWLAANRGKLVDVRSVTGTDNWRVIVQPVTYRSFDPATGQVTRTQSTLIVGVDLGDVNGTINQLAYIDLVVSGIVLVALAVVGVAIVRASLRPLTDIELTAGAIAAGDLSQRVPDRDPRTEVGRLGRSLNAMLAQVETAFHAREKSEAAALRSEEKMRQFVADASHELRTPLTAIRGYAEYYRQRGGAGNGARHAAPADAEPIMAGGGRLTEPDIDRIMERVEQESARMGVLVEDMLLLARLDQQRPLERRPVDLLTLAADAVQDARMIAPRRKIELTVGHGAAFLVLGDEARLRQVITNLMSNALSHTPDDTPIDVRILTHGPDGRLPVPSVTIEVDDHGPCLSKEQAERVFERFYRADQARGRKTGGAGLGLAIVAALVDAHGGAVGVDTAPGSGAMFWITLPLAAEAA